jgi:acetyltransferase
MNLFLPCGVVRVHSDPEYRTAEYATLDRSDLKGRQLGWLLMELMNEYPRAEGLQSIRGQVLEDNRTMLSLAKPFCRPYLTHS